MAQDRPTQKQWQEYSKNLSKADEYNLAVASHISFMDKAELIVCGAALIACLNGITSATSNPDLYSALLRAASAFFLAGTIRVVAMEFRSSQYGFLRDAAYATASFQLHQDMEKHRIELDAALDSHKTATRRAIWFGATGRMATTLAVVWAVYLLHKATPSPALAF